MQQDNIHTTSEQLSILQLFTELGRIVVGMQQDNIHTTSEQLSIGEEEEGISSPIAAQILDFCDQGVGGHLFPPTDQLPSFADEPPEDQVFSCSSPSALAAVSTGVSNPTPLPCFPEDTPFSLFTALDAAALSALLDASPVQLPFPEADLLPAGLYPSSSSSSSSLNPPLSIFSALPLSAGDLHLDTLEDQISIGDVTTSGYRPYSPDPASVKMATALSSPSRHQQQGSAREAGYYSTALAGMLKEQQPGFMGIEGDALEGSGVGPMYYRRARAHGDGSHGLFYNGGMIATKPEAGYPGPADMVDYQRMDGGLGLYGQEAALPAAYRANDMQALGVGGGSQSLLAGSGGNPSSLPAPDVPAVDESNYKVGRLSIKERKEKIHRYIKKRNERNFSKKIKYACRKTLADSRPRVRGRFARNDESGEITKPSSRSNEFDDEDVVMVKDEGNIPVPSDIFSHIGSVNSINYNFTLESWL